MGRNRGITSITTPVEYGVAMLESDPDRPSAWLLRIDGTQQSHVDLADPVHLEFEYVRRIGHLLDLMPAGPVRAVHLGAGALTLARYIGATRRGSHNLVVERDGQLVDVVRENLPWPREYRIRVRIGDARAALDALRPASTDVVICDVFAGARTPAAMTTKQAFAAASRALAPSGQFIANIADQAPLSYTRAFCAGVAATFPQVVLVVEPNVLRGRRFGNLVIGAGAAPFDEVGLSRLCSADPWPSRVIGGSDLRRFIGPAAAFDDLSAEDSPEPPEGAFD